MATEVKMAMAGGDLSAVLIGLTGLHFGNALLSAMDVPNKTPVQFDRSTLPPTLVERKAGAILVKQSCSR
jgi:hypothetical protein